MELIKEIQLDSKEVEEAITDYLKKEGYKSISFKFKAQDSSEFIPLKYPVTAAIVVEEMRID